MNSTLYNKITEFTQWFLANQDNARDADKCTMFLKRAISCQLEINLLLIQKILDLTDNCDELVKRLKQEGR